MQSQCGDRKADDLANVLSRHVPELYDDFRLRPMLTQLIRTSCHLGDAMGGSVSLVDGDAGRYTKVAEVGTACRLGQSFPLDEGVTGEVLSRRAPVVLRTYRDLRSGHLKQGHPAADGAVAAIPIWWRAEIVAVNVVFAGVARPFTTGEIDHLELVTQVIAPGLVTAVERELPDRTTGLRHRPVELSPADLATRAAVASVTDVVAGLIDLTQRVSPPLDHDVNPGLQVRVVGGNGTPRLLFRPDQETSPWSGQTSAPWRELVDAGSGVVAVQAGDSASADPGTRHRDQAASASPFSSREQQVAELLSRGLSDREIAHELFLSPKTVEKHVSAVLRKTEAPSRTAAVVRSLERGWL